jgi:hypothetical protein
MSVPTDHVKHESTPPSGTTLVSLAIAAAGDALRPCHQFATELDRGMAAADLAAAIRCAAPLLTEDERGAMALYLYPEGGVR